MLTHEQIIDWILTMRKTDEDYARYALQQYHAAMPWMDLMAGIRDAMKAPNA